MARGIGLISRRNNLTQRGVGRPSGALAFVLTFVLICALGVFAILNERRALAADVIFANHFIWLADVGAAAAISVGDCTVSSHIQFLDLGHKAVCRSSLYGQRYTAEYFYSILGNFTVIEQTGI